MECWKIYGDLFSMRKHPYPNALSVMSKVADMQAAGMIRSRDVGCVALTVDGWKWWAKVMRDNGGKKDPMASGLYAVEEISSSSSPSER